MPLFLTFSGIIGVFGGLHPLTAVERNQLRGSIPRFSFDSKYARYQKHGAPAGSAYFKREAFLP